jgi:SAM-dependent methyltransferase
VSNVDTRTVEGFGEEWTRYDQSGLSEAERNEVFAGYFRIFPWEALPAEPVGFDLGCGSGRWAMVVAPRVRRLHCIDASEAALRVARKNLQAVGNCEFHLATVDNIPLADGTMDFGYSLGVLHHVPDTLEGIRACVARLKPGAPLLLYLYYAFDNRPSWYRGLWRVSDAIRRGVAALPLGGRYPVSMLFAALVYLPLARLSLVLERFGLPVGSIPLSAYRRRSFYVMRTDALDRFGTRLEQRFTAAQIRRMMQDAGLEKIVFSDSVPFWCAVGFKKNDIQH